MSEKSTKDNTANPEVLPVRIVTSLSGKSIIVEWMDGAYIKRATIPVKKLHPNPPGVEKSILEAGLPFGADWEAVALPPGQSPQDFANQMRLSNLWTTENAMANPQDTTRICQSFGIPFSTIVEFVYRKEV